MTEVTAQQIKDAIDAYCAEAYDDGHRTHLGASLIGHECSRHLWYVFRWVRHERFPPRMLRLFNRGHREEARFIEWLRGIGWEVSDRPSKGCSLAYHPESDSYSYETKSNPGDGLVEDVSGEIEHVDRAAERGILPPVKQTQHRVSAVMGHFGGSLDGLGRPEEKLHAIEDDDDAYLLEFKTSGTGAGFTSSVEKGVKRAKPKHWAQMCVYGYLRNLKRALYLIINKNDDDFHPEIVELDHNYGMELTEKAASIIRSKEPPNRISQSAAFHVCKTCNFRDICFDGVKPEKNCRSCKYALPIDDAQWRCTKFGETIPSEFIASGCDEWSSIT